MFDHLESAVFSSETCSAIPTSTELIPVYDVYIVEHIGDRIYLPAILPLFELDTTNETSRSWTIF